MRLTGGRRAYEWGTNAKHNGVSVLIDDAGRLGISASKIAFDRLVGSWYEIYLCDLDGSNVEAFSITGLPSKHRGNPSWHPNGDWLLVQGQQAGSSETTKAKPGIGKDNDLYAVSYPAGVATKIKAVTGGANDLGLVHAHFNTAGDKVAFSHYHSEPTAPDILGGSWDIHVYDWAVTGGVPALSNEATYTPDGAGWYKVHGYNSDDSKMLYTYGAEANTWQMDIFEGALSGAGTNLSNDAAAWCEHGHYGPGFTKVAYMSSKGVTTPTDDTIAQVATLETELWLMDVDGSNQKRMTNFNDEGFPEYTGVRTVAGDLMWTAGGTAVLIRTGLAGASEKVWKIDLASGDQDA